MDPRALVTGAGLMKQLDVDVNKKTAGRKPKVDRGKGSPMSSKASSRSSSKSPRRQRRPTELQLSTASRVHQFLPLLGKKSETKSARKARERRARDEEREARSAAEAVKSRSRMLKALVEVSRLRQRVEEGDATQREITDAINKSTREAVECTRRVIRMCTETQKTGCKVFVDLETQLAQLDNIEDTLGNINYEMHCAEEDMKDLGDLCCGMCVLPWDREPSFEDSDAYIGTWQESLGQSVVTTQPTSSGCKPPSPLKLGQFILPRLSDHSDEDELAANVKRITELMPALCSIGKDVNFELQQQAEQCARIWDKAQSVDLRVKLTKERTQKLLEGDND